METINIATSADLAHPGQPSIIRTAAELGEVTVGVFAESGMGTLLFPEFFKR